MSNSKRDFTVYGIGTIATEPITVVAESFPEALDLFRKLGALFAAPPLCELCEAEIEIHTLVISDGSGQVYEVPSAIVPVQFRFLRML
jgi:hypothetical protein